MVAAGELRAALRGSAPFAAELAAFRETAAALRGRDGADASLTGVLTALDAHAEDGIPSLESLGRGLNGLAPRLVATASQEETFLEEKGWIAALRARLGSLISIRRTGAAVPGTTAEAAVARAEAALAAGDLKTAVTEVEALEDGSAHFAAPWLAAARARLAAEESLTKISRRVTAILARQESREPPMGPFTDPRGDGG